MRFSPTFDGPTIQRAPRRIYLLILLTLAVALSRAQIQEPETHANTIYGTVLNSVTREPIGRALVSSRDNRLATLTDSEGHFEFELPKQAGPDPQIPMPMTFLAARKPGFLEDQSPDLEFAATPGHEITLSLTPESIIKGRITFPDDDVPPGFMVLLFARNVQEGIPRWVQHNAVQVNSNGEFRFADLPPGDYKIGTNELLDNNPAVTVPGGQLYGFPPTFNPGAADFSHASTIHVASGQIAQADFSVTHQPYYPVRIPVTNPDANGMNVSISPQGRPGPGYSLGYNAERQRIEGALPNGNYIVEAATFNQNSATGSVGILVNGGPTDGQALALTRNFSLAVNVREEFSATDKDAPQVGTFGNGQRSFSIHGPRLYLNLSGVNADDFGPQMSPSLRPPTGPNDDSLVLENLAPGRYWLMAQTGRGYVATATLGGVDLLRNPLVVSAGGTEPIEITLRDDSAEIDGTVPGTNSKTMESDSGPNQGTIYWIYCVPLPDGAGQYQLSMSAEGKFTFRNMAPGSYRILAFNRRQPDLPYRDAELMKAYESKGQVVHLSAGQKATLQVQLVSND